MIKTITKQVCVCDMCGYQYGWDNEPEVPKEVFEFTVKLEDGPTIIQICPKCQVKLRRAFKRSLNERYDFCVSESQEEEEND
jgi:hypothetical protein